MPLYRISKDGYECITCGAKFQFPSQTLKHIRHEHGNIYAEHLKRHPGEGHK